MYKKGISLSINMVVVIVLGVVLVGVGLLLIQRISDPLQKYEQAIGDNLKSELLRLRFTDDQRVGLLNTHEVVNRGDDAYFLLGFVNKDLEEKHFKVYTEYVNSTVHDAFSQTYYYSNPGADAMLLHAFRAPSDPVVLMPNERHFMWIVAVPPKSIPRGDYLFDVYVCIKDGSSVSGDLCSEQYSGYKTFTGVKQRIYLNVR